jgi:hypothetical protein
MPTPLAFKRALFEVHPGSFDGTALTVACRLAELLKLNVVGLLTPGHAAQDLAGYSTFREYVPGLGTWQPLDLGRLVLEQQTAARTLERLFRQLVGAWPVPASFEVMLNAAPVSVDAADILVVIQPRDPSASLTHGFAGALEAALRSTASVLLVPRWARWRRGPVVVIASAADDPAFAVASQVALASQTDVIRIEVPTAAVGSASGAEQTARSGCPTVQPKKWFSDTRQISALLDGVTESLLVFTRDGVTEAGIAIAEARHTPALIVEAPQAGGP